MALICGVVGPFDVEDDTVAARLELRHVLA
jgi:hypothetical protein